MSKNMSIEKTFASAVQNHQKNNFKVAENLYNQVLKIDPNHIKTIFFLGTLSVQTKNFGRAKQMLQKTIQVQPNNVDAHNNLGVVFKEFEKFQKAKDCFERVIQIQPNHVDAVNNLGNVFKQLGKPQKAIDYYQRAIEIEPSYVGAHYNLMEICEKTNRIIELKNAVSNAKTIFKDNSIIKLYEGILLSRNEKFVEAKNCLKLISFESNEINKEIIRVSTLAKCYDRIGDTDKAFNYFKKANLLTQKTKIKNFDKNKYLQEIKIRKEFFKKSKIEKWPTLKQPDNEPSPIFLIGFPRSGTTLLDTILRSHPSIEVIEEKPMVDKLIYSLNELTENNFENLKKIEIDQIKKIRNIYFKNLDIHIQNNHNSKIYIDKLPLNIINVGEIIRIFPKSKFIISLRHPCDCVLSCFMQDFELNNAMANFLNLEDSAKLYDLVMKLWIQYTSIFPINYYEVRYENLVENLETTVKPLLKFLELPWHDSVLEFYKTAKKGPQIKTPSYDQVIKPIYSEASGRWKMYKKQTTNIYPILEPWIKKFNY